MIKFLALIGTGLSVAVAANSAAYGQVESDAGGYLELEAGPAWFSRNQVRIPNNDQGTRFDLRDLTGSGPDAYARLYATYEFNPRHALRLNIAPLQVSGTQVLEEDILFRGSEFTGGEPITGSYKFNTYRLTYRWMFHQDARLDLGLGAALLVRDAKIQLTQDTQHEYKDDLGLVPLLHLYGAYRMNERTSLVFDLEGAGAPQGRALDASLKVHHALGEGWDVSFGYRTLEGGADNDELYTFAWVHYLVLGLGYRFP